MNCISRCGSWMWHFRALSLSWTRGLAVWEPMGFICITTPSIWEACTGEDRVMVNRIYLHLVLHGIFRHMIRRKGREEERYSLACDIVTESIIDGMRHRCVLRSRSWLRRETYRRLGKEMKVLTAEKVYGALEKWNLSEAEFARLAGEFRVDDHSYWPADDDQKKQSQIENQWQDISEQMETDMETFSKEASQESGHLIDQVKVENRVRFDYRQFLRKFSVLKERWQ